MIHEKPDNFSDDVSVPRPRTVTVMGLVMTTAFVVSYLGAYALPGALVGSGVLAAWPAGDDPRLRWMLVGFGAMMGLFLLATAAFRLVNRSQMRRIDAMAEG